MRVKEEERRSANQKINKSVSIIIFLRLILRILFYSFLVVLSIFHFLHFTSANIPTFSLLLVPPQGGVNICM